MSLYSYFTDNYILRIFPDVIRFYCRRAKGLLLYSGFTQQIIYIKLSKLNTPLKNNQMLIYQKRNIRNIQRLLKNQFGKKRGMELFNQADILDVIVVKNTCRKICRYLKALNKIRNSDVYNSKIFHMVFESSKSQDDEIATVIYQSIYHKFDRLIQSIENGFQKKNIGREKDDLVRPFNKVKNRLDWLKHARNTSGKIYYRIKGKTLIPPKLKELIEEEIYNIKNAKILKPGVYEGVEMYR